MKYNAFDYIPSYSVRPIVRSCAHHAFISNVPPQLETCEFSIHRRFRSAVAMSKSGKLAAASSGPVVAKYPFDLPPAYTAEYQSCNLG